MTTVEFTAQGNHSFQTMRVFGIQRDQIIRNLDRNNDQKLNAAELSQGILNALNTGQNDTAAVYSSLLLSINGDITAQVINRPDRRFKFIKLDQDNDLALSAAEIRTPNGLPFTLSPREGELRNQGFVLVGTGVPSLPGFETIFTPDSIQRLRENALRGLGVQNSSGPALDPFVEQLYLDQNPDVAAAVQRGEFASGLQHFQLNGQAEGRQFGASSNDEKLYLAQNPDVAAAVARGEFTSGLQHFQLHGQKEGREFRVSSADEKRYLAQNPDVAAAVARGQFESGVQHFLLNGQAEGRKFGD
jgi:hypothetical protein